MSAQKSKKSKALTYVLGFFLLIGVAGEVAVLYAIDDPLMRLRLGLVCLAMIAWPDVRRSLLTYRTFGPVVGWNAVR